MLDICWAEAVILLFTSNVFVNDKFRKHNRHYFSQNEQDSHDKSRP